MSSQGDLVISETLTIPAWELSERFILASGPGGQNVNKVASAVQLRWAVKASSLPAAIKTRFMKRYGARITTEGDILIEARSQRSQALNRADARRRLADMVRAIATPPKRRIATRPTRSSVRRRLASKKKRANIKALRGKIDSED